MREEILRRFGNDLSSAESEIVRELEARKVLISVLLFDPDQSSLDFLKSLLLMAESVESLEIELAIRNNCPNQIDIEGSVKSNLVKVIYSSGENLGFSKGHNFNFMASDSDFFLVINDDIVLEDLNWLLHSVKMMQENEKVAAVGSATSPRFLDSFGNGRRELAGQNEPDYAEASILTIRSSAFRKMGGFDEKIEYFYFEDADLCLKLKQKGYGIEFVKIPHTHKRSRSSSRIPQVVVQSNYELNRAKFISRWGDYLKTRRFTGSALIKMNSDGFGDIADCIYPLAELIGRISQTSSVTIFTPNPKNNFILKFLGVDVRNSLVDSSHDREYAIDDINFSPPFHTLDLIAARLGIENFNTDEGPVKQYATTYPLSQNFSVPESGYNIIHLDSQRKSFEGRQPELRKFIPCLEVLSNKPVILIGQNSKSDFCAEYEQHIRKHDVIDLREVATVRDMAILVAKSDMFFGIDSGPSHLAQLFNIPSFVFYGPIHPLTKLYRLNNSGTYYKNDEDSGLYHRMLQPSYYFDLKRSIRCLDIDEKKMAVQLSEFINSKFKFDWTPYVESLRLRQREWLLLQMHNPIYLNRILRKQDQSMKQYSDGFLKKTR